MNTGGADGAPPGTVLHVSPHPDDECIGAPATLMALRDHGWHVVNLACSLGAATERPRRLAEVRAACQRAGFTLEMVGDGDEDGALRDGLRDLRATSAHDVLVEELVDAMERHRPVVVVAPSPHDRHPGHEVVGRATVHALCRNGANGAGMPPLWLWGLWADLPFPTIATAFDSARLDEIEGVLDAHVGELARNDYRRLVRGRAEMNASLGPERVFGFGSAANDAPYVEVLCEVVRSGGRWRLGRPRWLEPAAPLGPDAGAAGAGGADIAEWLEAPSLTTRFGPPPSGAHSADSR